MDNRVWERLPDESLKAWTAFQMYRDLGSVRSYSKVAIALGKSPATYKRRLEIWGSKFSWVKRCRQYDLYLARSSSLEKIRPDEYAKKIETYRSETEKMSKAMVSMGARAMQVLQTELVARLEREEKLKPHEISVLIKASVYAVDVGSRLQSEALNVDKLVSLLAEIKTQSP
ncbi:MAG: hypothetical protein HC862_24320 [Scytonema sp. RU_4_4]|nr:hypothetical protein [Scytonema sp. RU_4_4]